MSKYLELWKYIESNNKEEYKLSFQEIKGILGFELDHSFLKYKKELLDYSYEVVKISLKDKTVLIRRMSDK